MPPRCKFTKEQIVDTALDICREAGPEAVTARAVAARLGSSPKVIFGAFSGMEELRQELIKSAYQLYQQRTFSAMREKRYPPYKASGMAYISFAREEKELFKLLFMRDRRQELIEEDEDFVGPIVELIMKNTGLSRQEAYTFHLELWLIVHGIAAMLATGFLDWDEEFISRALTDSYQGLKHRFCGGE